MSEKPNFLSEYTANLINFSKYDCNDSDNSVIITIFADSFRNVITEMN